VRNLPLISVSLLVLLAVAAGPAQAADLGGDCCADLEARVAALEASTAHKGNRKVSLTIAGRVAATMTYWAETSPGPVRLGATAAENGPNDHKSDVYFGDASGSGPQLVVKGAAKVTSDVTAGYYLELSVGAFDGTHGGVDQFGAGQSTKGNTQVSHQAAGSVKPANTYVYVSSVRLGTLQLGKVDNAGDQYVSSLNGAWMGGYTEGRAGKSFLIRRLDGLLSPPSYGDVLSRLNPRGETGLRYISPSLGGLTFNASAHGDDIWGVGANYAGTSGTITVKAGIGFGALGRVDGLVNTAPNVDMPLNPRLLGVSGGLKDSASGLFLEGAWSRRTESAPADVGDASNVFLSGGWAKNVLGTGDTTLYANYDRTLGNVMGINAGFLLSVAAQSVAVGIDQRIDAAASHLFLTYEKTSFDGATTLGGVPFVPEQSIDTVTAGMSIEF
jgi:hypothetical protein